MKKQYFTALIIVVAMLVVSCAADSESVGVNGKTGRGGSMARFTIVGNHLYTVDKTNLKVFNITQTHVPKYTNDIEVGFNVETIFPLKDKLYMGSETGMYIYDISTPGFPKAVSYYEHVVACDPVVSDGKYAYVTLNSFSERCWRSTNELQVVSLEHLQRPELIATYPMSNPRGLALKDNKLWVCDDGLRVFDVSDKKNLVETNHFTDLTAYDLILDDDRALVIGESGFVQYKIETDTIKRLSEINIGF